MIIWKGLGILIAVVGIGAAIATGLAADYFAYDWSHAHPKALNFVIMTAAAIALFGLALLLRKFDKPRVLIDKSTGREVVLRRGDSLFFIPPMGWPFIVFGLAIAQLFMGAE